MATTLVPDYEKRYLVYCEDCFKSKQKTMSRLEYGIFELGRIVRYRNRRLITKSEYNQDRKALEKFMGL